MRKIVFLGLLASILQTPAKADVDSELIACLQERDQKLRLECFQNIACTVSEKHKKEKPVYCEITGMKADIAERIVQIVSDHLGVDKNKILRNSYFIDDLGADSLDTVELVMAFEEEFGVEIPDEAAEKIQTVQDAINYIESNK